MAKISKITCFLILQTCLFSINSDLYAQNTYPIEGIIKDNTTNEVLIGANVFLIGTGFGTTTDTDGKFFLKNIPEGKYTIRVSYLGYKTIEQEISIPTTGKQKRDFSLVPEVLEGNTVVVTGQAQGQNEAINKQISSIQIMSVVSSSRIQELADANAAESVGRLPGVSIVRSGGEGTQIVIRGLQPKYNAISVNGVRMASSNASDRSTDLSMISPYSLEGIEVIKVVTPDIDPDVIGGTVNFRMREAKGESEGFGLNVLAQGAYTGLPNAYNKYRNYKYVGSIEGRFFEGLFGVFAQGDMERRNLTSNEFGASYGNQGSSLTEYTVLGLNLNNIPRDKQRTNGTLDLDLKLPEGKISLSNFFSSGNTEVQNRGEFFNIQNNVHNYSLAFSKSTISVITNAFEIDHQIPIFHANVKVSHSYSETKSPADWTIGFQQGSAGVGSFANISNINPYDIPTAANNDTNSTFLASIITNNSFSKERALAGSLDLDAAMNISDLTTVLFKFGGKYRQQKRSYVYDQSGGQGLGLSSAQYVDSLIASQFSSTGQYVNTTSIPIRPFVDPNYTYGEFLNGDFPMILPLNYSMLSQTAAFIKSRTDLIAQHDAIAYFHDDFNSTTNNYSGTENQTAYYVMATVTVGSYLTIIPGIRHQEIQTTYTAARGRQNTASLLGGVYNHYDTTLTVNHAYWLPGIILKYKPFEWFDVRISYTNTLAYPDYNAIFPKIDVSTIGSIAWNNYKLNPTRSKNYDVSLSFYNNTIGLFSVSGFLKKIDDLIYPRNFFLSDSAVLPYFPPGPVSTAPRGVYNISTFVNNPFQVKVWGFETDWQTHFWYLPHPLDGFVLNFNYTHVYSRAEYPYTDSRKEGRVIYHVDTSFVDRLIYQPNDIVNLSVGYDYKDFSVRISMLYQADIFSTAGYWPQLRSSTLPYHRWDISAKQELPIPGLQIYGDINNLNSAFDINVIHASAGVPQSKQSYGLSGDLGLRWTF